MRAFAGLACALVVGSAPAEARAQKPDADVSAQAKQLFSEGFAATNLAQWDKARTFLLSAWRIQQHWKIAANLGRAEFKTGRMRDAAEHLRFFLDTAPADVDARERKSAADMLKSARGKVGAAKVTSAPEGAELFVDDAAIGKLPASGVIFLEPGQRRVEGRAPGYTNAGQTVEVGAGKEISLELKLAKVPVQRVQVRVVHDRGSAPPLPLGQSKAVVIAGTAAGAVALGLGVSAMIGSFAKAGRVNDLNAKTPCLDFPYECSRPAVDAEHARVTLANVAVTSLLVAGAIGAATVTYALAMPSSKVKNKVSASVAVGPAGVGLAASIRW